MPKLIIEVDQARLLIEKEAGEEVRISQLDEISPAENINTVIRDNEKEIVVELFLDDTDRRTLEEVANDLGTHMGHVRMMRYQFKNEGRTPGKSRFEMLREFYKVI